MNFFVRPENMKRVPKQWLPEEDIVTYMRQDKLVKVNVDEKGNIDEDNFVIEEVSVEKERVNRRDYINSFNDEVGIENILKKIALSGDASLANQIKRVPQPLAQDGKEQIIDITALQDGEEAVAKMGDNMRKAFKELPDELKAGRSLEQFCEGISQAEIDAFVAAQVQKKLGGNK